MILAESSGIHKLLELKMVVSVIYMGIFLRCIFFFFSGVGLIFWGGGPGVKSGGIDFDTRAFLIVL